MPKIKSLHIRSIEFEIGDFWCQNSSVRVDFDMSLSSELLTNLLPLKYPFMVLHVFIWLETTWTFNQKTIIQRFQKIYLDCVVQNGSFAWQIEYYFTYTHILHKENSAISKCKCGMRISLEISWKFTFFELTGSLIQNILVYWFKTRFLSKSKLS